MPFRFQSIRQTRQNQIDPDGESVQGNASQQSLDTPQQSRAARRENSRQLLLSHLRIGSEPDHELVTIPTARRGNANPLRPPPDAPTAHLTGAAYLRAILADESENQMGGFFKAVIEGRYILGAGNLTDARAHEVAERLRPIVAQCLQDAELKDAIDELAGETMGRCGDGTQMFIGKMETLAILSAVKNGAMDADDLYNLGVAFFRLDAVQTAVGRRTQPGLDMQNVHNIFNAEVGLQEELNLPTHHTAPFLPEMGFVNRSVLREISAEVKARLCANQGAEVFDYLGSWEPWQNFVIATPPADRRDFDMVTRTFHKQLERVEQEWENRDTVPMTREKYEEKLNGISRNRTVWMSELAGQKAAELLFNARAATGIDRGNMSTYFRQN